MDMSDANPQGTAVPLESGQYDGQFALPNAFFGSTLFVSDKNVRQVDCDFSGVKYPVMTSIIPSRLSAAKADSRAWAVQSLYSPEVFWPFYKTVVEKTWKLYRGFSSNHFCLTEMHKTGNLKSEGEVDYPKATMGESETKTRWLPSDIEENIAQGVATGNMDMPTRELSKTRPVLVGFIAGYSAATTRASIGYISGSEWVVRGPLARGEYVIEYCVWMENEVSNRHPWPASCLPTDLPPIRPYGPLATEPNIRAWWAEVRKPNGWLSRAATTCPVAARAFNYSPPVVASTTI
jgi:hypothetical protein